MKKFHIMIAPVEIELEVTADVTDPKRPTLDDVYLNGVSILKALKRSQKLGLAKAAAEQAEEMAETG